MLSKINLYPFPKLHFTRLGSVFQEHLLEYSQPLSKTLWILFPFNHSQNNKNFEDTHE